MMKCTDIKERLLDYLDNNLSGNEKKEFESHIKEFNHCLNELKQFKELNNKLLSVKPIECPENFINEFNRKFEDEQNKLHHKSTFYNSFKTVLKVAAAILLFVGGTFFGKTMQNQKGVNTKLTVLEQEVNQLKQQVYLTALKEKTPSEKILAIDSLNNYEINQDLLNTFSFLLNNDESINVRLETAEALYGFSRYQSTRDILINALNTEQKPIVQIKLINYLMDIEEIRLIQPLREIINDGNTNIIVKEYAQSSLQTINKPGLKWN